MALKAVILAAGDGGRLRPLTLDTPKILLDLGGRPLIYWTLENFLRNGISDVGIVVGHNSQRIVEALGDCMEGLNLEFIENPHWEGGNAISVQAARDFVAGEPFLLCMGDHLVGSNVVSALTEAETGDNFLCVDFIPTHSSQINDGTKVVVDSDWCIADIGKDLAIWDAIDVGYFKLTESAFDVIAMLSHSQGIHVELSDVVRHFAGTDRPFRASDVTGAWWFDIDTPEDYRTVSRLMAESGS